MMKTTDDLNEIVENMDILFTEERHLNGVRICVRAYWSSGGHKCVIGFLPEQFESDGDKFFQTSQNPPLGVRTWVLPMYIISDEGLTGAASMVVEIKPDLTWYVYALTHQNLLTQNITPKL